MINEKGEILPQGMRGFEEVFKNSRPKKQPQQKKSVAAVQPPSKAVLGLEEDVRRLKDEAFTMKCKLKTTDAMVRRS